MGLKHSVTAGSGSGAGGLVNGTDWNAEHVVEWTQIASSGTLSGTQFDFTSIPQTYTDLLLTLEGVSHNNGSNTTLQMVIGDGTWTSGSVVISASYAAASAVTGGILIPGYCLSKGFALLGTNAAMSSTAEIAANSSTGTGPSLAWRVPAGIQFLRIRHASGSFDAGTAILYGR